MSERPSLAEAFRPASRRAAAAPLKLDGASVVAPEQRSGIRVMQAPGKVRGLTATDMVVEAFAQHGANYHELTPELVHRPAVSAAATATIQIQLRPDDRQHGWLDTQVERHGAPSRSALASAVLSRHLQRRGPMTGYRSRKRPSTHRSAQLA